MLSDKDDSLSALHQCFKRTPLPFRQLSIPVLQLKQNASFPVPIDETVNVCRCYLAKA
jgi:hypothetical protein